MKEDAWYSINGNYKLTVQHAEGTQDYNLEVKSNSSATLVGKDTMAVRFTYDGKNVKINFAPQQRRNAGAAGRPGMGGAANEQQHSLQTQIN